MTKIRIAVSILVAGLVVGCASDRPWKVNASDERRYGESVEACRALTDDAAGFVKCMKRRGWRREYPGGF